MILKHLSLIVILITLMAGAQDSHANEDRTASMPRAVIPQIDIEKDAPVTDDLDDYIPPPMFGDPPAAPQLPQKINDNNDNDDVKVFEINQQTTTINPKPGDKINAKLKRRVSKKKKIDTPPRTVIRQNTIVNAPIPKRRPSTMRVSADYAQRLRDLTDTGHHDRAPDWSRALEKFTPDDTPVTDDDTDYLSEGFDDEPPYENAPLLAGGRLKNTDIYDILKQIDPAAAAQLKDSMAHNDPPPERVKAVINSAAFRRISAMPLAMGKNNAPVRINFLPKQVGFISPPPQKQLEYLLILSKMAPRKRIEIHAYPSYATPTAKAARALSYARALSIKKFLIDHRIPAGMIDIRPANANAHKYDFAEIIFQEIIF